MIGITQPPLGARLVWNPRKSPEPDGGTLRDEPSPKGRRTFRAYQDGVVPEYLLNGCGGVLGVQDERRIGRTALKLWRHLLWERGYELRPRRFSVTATALRLGLAHRTTDHAIARLKAASMVEVRVRRIRSEVTGAWVSEAWVTVYGGIDEDPRLGELLWVPEATLAWCAGRPEWGGDRPGSGRPPKNQVGVSHAESPTTDRTLTESSWRSKKNTEKSNEYLLVANATSNAPAAGAILLTVERKHMTSTPADPHRTTLAPIRLRPEDPAESQVRFLVQSYNRAVREVYPDDNKTWCRLPSDPAKSKIYGRLKAAAQACLDHDIPPGAWAAWALRLSHTMAVKKNKAPRAVPIVAIFSASYIAAKRGWFRKESEHTYGVAYKPDQAAYERHFRTREARTPGYLLPFPKWYGELRRQEIAQGALDPLERMTRDYKAVVTRAEAPAPTAAMEEYCRQREARTPGNLLPFPKWYGAIRREEIAAGVTNPLAAWPARKLTYQTPTRTPGVQGAAPSELNYTRWSPA